MVAVGTQVALEPPPIQFRWIIILASAGAMLCQVVCIVVVVWYGSSVYDGRGCVLVWL